MLSWLLDFGGSVDNMGGLEEAIRNYGSPVKIMKLDDYYYERFNQYPLDANVIFNGSINVGEKLKQYDKGWNPGVLYDEEKLKCSYYYPILGDELVNSEYLFAPFGELERLWFNFTEYFKTSDIFLRPDSGGKSFSGQVIENLERFFKREKVYIDESVKPSDMCVVAPAQNLLKEYRFVIIDGKVITGSQYRVKGKVEYSADVPDDARQYTQSLLDNGFRPDDAFVLDIARLKDKVHKVIEINSFSCSGLYECDKNAIVKAADEYFGQKE